MSMKTKYAVCACLNLARMPEGKTAFIADLSREGRLPQKFLESILQDLRRVGLLTSRKGRSGGYALARPARQIKLGEIFRATGSLDFALGHAFGRSEPDFLGEGIGEESVCRLLEDVEKSIFRLLDGISLQDLLERWLASRLEHVEDWVI
jgi:Rrf2 family protein